MVRPLTLISEHGVNSSKFAPLSPLSPHISHDINGTQQVDLLQTLYKRDQASSNQGTYYYLSTHYTCVLERKPT